jgi:hypothetical protein
MPINRISLGFTLALLAGAVPLAGQDPGRVSAARSPSAARPRVPVPRPPLETILADLDRQSPGQARPRAPSGVVATNPLDQPATLSMDNLKWLGPGEEHITLVGRRIGFYGGSAVLAQGGELGVSLVVPRGDYIVRFDVASGLGGSVEIGYPSGGWMARCSVPMQAQPANCATVLHVQSSYQGVVLKASGEVWVRSVTVVHLPP